MRILQVCINAMMTERPEDRWTVSQILSALQAILEGAKILPATLEATLQGTDVPVVRSVAGPADFAIDDLTDEFKTTADITGDKPGMAAKKAEAATEPGKPAENAKKEEKEAPAPEIGHPLASEQAAPRRGGFMGLFLGLGVAGMAGAAVVGVALVVVVLLGGAWSLGYFGGESSGGLNPVVIDVQPSKVKGKTAKAWRGKFKGVELINNSNTHPERRSTTRALRQESRRLSTTCNVTGPVALDLYIGAKGKVLFVEVDERYLTPEATQCVANALMGIHLPRTSKRTARLRAALYLR
jgi:hypothetical protein